MTSSVLFITRNFPPLVGGMERLALESVRALASEWPVDLMGPRGCEQAADSAVKATGVAYRSVAAFMISGWWHGRRLARARDHSLVIGGSGLAAPLVRASARQRGAYTVCFVHGLDLVVENAFYRRCCLPALRAMDRIIANSRNTACLASDVGIQSDRIHVLNPGVQIGDEQPVSLFHSAFPQAVDRKLLLSVGRLLPRKGLVDFVGKVLPQLVEEYPDILLVVAGGTAKNALQRVGNEAHRLAEVVSRIRMHDHVLLTGQIDGQILASLYSAARLMVFPVKDITGDVEGFGMVALEAAAHGLPTVAFDAGGVSDAVSDGVSGTIVEPGDFQRMIEVIAEYLADKPGYANASSCRTYAENYAWPRYGERLRDLLRDQMRF